jgi:hypothetical protein
MKRMENKRKYIIIVLIVVIIIGIFLILKVNKNGENTKQLTQFEITVSSYVNLMPQGGYVDNTTEQVSFSFGLNGIDIEDFEKEYEIESIKLNGNLINNSDIIYRNNSFIIYSEEYKNNNKIELIIRNKNTNIKYLKKLEVKTEAAM